MSTIRDTFPKIYKIKDGKTGLPYWMVDARSKKWGMNERPSFNNEADALDRARQIEKHIKANGAQSAIPKDKLAHVKAYEALLERLRPFKKTPEDAVEHYVKFLGDEILSKTMPTVRQLIEWWQAHKLLDKSLDSQYRVEIKMHCKFIKSKWGDCRASEVRKNDIDTILRKHPGTNNTRKKYLTFIRMFFAWVLAEDKGYLVTNPATAVKFKSEKFEKEYYQPEPLKEFLKEIAVQYPQLVGYYTLLLFVGLRPSEGARVQWHHVNFKTSELHVIKGKTDARHIKLEPAAIAWLKWHNDNSQKNALFVPKKNMANLEKEARGLMPDKWIADGLRHTFATFYNSLIKDYPAVAWYMGNSVAAIKKHYAQTIPDEPLREFWAMTPEKVLDLKG